MMIYKNHKHNIYDNYYICHIIYVILYMSYYIVHIYRVYIMIISYYN